MTQFGLASAKGALFELPLLTQAAAQLVLAATPRVRESATFLELVAVRDPVASAKLLVMANSLPTPRKKTAGPVLRLRDAVNLVGSASAYSAVRSSAEAGLELEGLPPAGLSLRLFARSYMLSLSATVRLLAAAVSPPPSARLELVTAVSGLGLSALVGEPEGSETAAKDQLYVCAQRDDFQLHKHETLRKWLCSSLETLTRWGANPDILSEAKSLCNELVQVYDNPEYVDRCSVSAGLVYTAQWLLSRPADTPLDPSEVARLPMPVQSVLGHSAQGASLFRMRVS